MRWLLRLLVPFLCVLSLAAQAQVATVRVEAYGPFVVLDSRRAALIGSTDERSPAAFRAMLRRHPSLEQLVFVECPGTHDDVSNLALGRMIRAARLETYVPPGASVRSGAVELFLAGIRRRIDDGAMFAVHAWRDERGYEAGDFAADSPQHRKYVAYYAEMGMSRRNAEAEAFYAMTNAAPHLSARWLTAAEMRAWIQPAGTRGR